MAILVALILIVAGLMFVGFILGLIGYAWWLIAIALGSGEDVRSERRKAKNV